VSTSSPAVAIATRISRHPIIDNHKILSLLLHLQNKIPSSCPVPSTCNTIKSINNSRRNESILVRQPTCIYPTIPRTHHYHLAKPSNRATNGSSTTPAAPSTPPTYKISASSTTTSPTRKMSTSWPPSEATRIAT
jgi:hypothetical protein